MKVKRSRRWLALCGSGVSNNDEVGEDGGGYEQDDRMHGDEQVIQSGRYP